MMRSDCRGRRWPRCSLQLRRRPTRRRRPPAAPVVEADPVRCWWRTDRASIRMGEPFEAVLTCAALETDLDAGRGRSLAARSDGVRAAALRRARRHGRRGRDDRRSPLLPVHLSAAPAERHRVRPGRVARRAVAHLPHRYPDQRRHDLAGARPDLQPAGAVAPRAVARAGRRPRHPRRQLADLRRPRVAALPRPGPRHPGLGALRPGRGRGGARRGARLRRARRAGPGAIVAGVGAGHPAARPPRAGRRQPVAAGRRLDRRAGGAGHGGAADRGRLRDRRAGRTESGTGRARCRTGSSRSARGWCGGGTRWCRRRPPRPTSIGPPRPAGRCSACATASLQRRRRASDAPPSTRARWRARSARRRTLAGQLAWRHSWPVVQWTRFARRVAAWQGRA